MRPAIGATVAAAARATRPAPAAVPLAALLLALLAFAACGPPPPPVLPGEIDSAQAILARLRARADSLGTIRAGLELRWDDAHLEEPESCRGSLSWAAPDRLRLRGHTAAFFTVFDLAAVGNEVRLDIPREQLFVYGRRDDPAWRELPFPPDLLRLAVLADASRLDGAPDARLERITARDADTGGGGAAVVVAPGWRLEVDPATRLPRRWTSADAEIRWEDWAVRGRFAWPDHMVILAGGDGALRVSLGRVEVGRSVPESRFRLEVEDDREILTPQAAAIRWNREREASVPFPAPGAAADPR